MGFAIKIAPKYEYKVLYLIFDFKGQVFNIVCRLQEDFFGDQVYISHFPDFADEVFAGRCPEVSAEFFLQFF